MQPDSTTVKCNAKLRVFQYPDVIYILTGNTLLAFRPAGAIGLFLPIPDISVIADQPGPVYKQKIGACRNDAVTFLFLSSPGP